MTDSTGFDPPVQWGAPDPVPAAETISDPAPAPGPEPTFEAVSATQDAPDPVPPPFIPENGAADWLREAITGLHDRLRALGG